MEHGMKVLATMVLALMAMLGIMAWLMAGKAHADVSKHTAAMYCAPLEELQSSLKSFRPFMRGNAGMAKENIGEIWINPGTSQWFFIQIVPASKLACVVLGGGDMAPVDISKEGDPA